MSNNSPVTSLQRKKVKSRVTSSPGYDDGSLEVGRITRRMQEDGNLCLESPVDSPLARRAAMSLLLGVPSDQSMNDSVASSFMDDPVTTDDSSRGSPRSDFSPEPFAEHHNARRRCRNELWPAIKSNYMYLMDEEIIDACKSTETELSSDDMSTETKVSYNEFLQQYKELTDWLEHLQLAMRRQTDSLSENYVNQIYHEEMLKQSPRQQLLNDYAKQLIQRYPHMTSEISSRLTRVNKQWSAVIGQLVPSRSSGKCHDLQTIISDIHKDLDALSVWVAKMEKSLAGLHINSDWTHDDLRDKLSEHESVQRDIESRGSVVSAILKLCKWLSSSEPVGGMDVKSFDGERNKVEVQVEALQHRWHGIWIQSVEWQLRLEDALAGRNRRADNLSLSGDEMLHLSIPRGIVQGPEDFPAYYSPSFTDAAQESDASNCSDIIPFRESDYEEIEDDDLMLTYGGSDSEPEVTRCSDVSPKDCQTVSGESMEAGLDSALGRSVSNPSLRTAVTDVNFNLLNAAETDVRLSSRSDAPDIGYASECHSNEEAENVLALPKSPEKSGEKSGLLTCNVSVKGAAISVNRPTLTSRYSATSAYNSGSDLSDSHREMGRKKMGLRPENWATTDLYCITALDNSESAGPFKPDFSPALCHDVKGDETDDDVARLMELPLDDDRCSSKLWKDLSLPLHDGHSVIRTHGRSLDSLAPLSSDKIVNTEKRVSSVEVIMDPDGDLPEQSHANIMGASQGTAGIREDELAEQLESGWIKSRVRRKKLIQSSCDASSEGTMSESESCETLSSEDEAGQRKRRVFGRRHHRKRNVSGSPLKSSVSLPVKSPTKRRVDSINESGDLESSAASRFPRSVSDGAISCSTVKKSKMSRTQMNSLVSGSPKSSIHSHKSQGSSVGLIRVGSSKVRGPLLLNFMSEFNDMHATQMAMLADDKLRPDHLLPGCPKLSRVLNYDAVVPDIGGSLTSVTADQSWNDDYQKLCDSCDMMDTVPSDAVTDDLSVDISLYDNSDQKIPTTNRRSSKLSLRHRRSWEDSDSDTEDFLNIVYESRKAFTFTEATLCEFHKEHLAGIVIRDPVEYNGPLATCQTNIKCLLELIVALESGSKVNDAQQKIQQITDIVERWRVLEAQTITQQNDCQQLYNLLAERVRIEREIEVLSRTAADVKFDDIQGLEMAVRSVQAARSDLSTTIGDQLNALECMVGSYHKKHSEVDVSRLVASLESLKHAKCMLLQRCCSKESFLKKTLMTWYQLNELQRHLEYVIEHELHQLDCLDEAASVIDLSAHDCEDMMRDLEVIREGWSAHRSKFQLLESLSQELSDVCSTQVQAELREFLSAIGSEFRRLYSKCEKIGHSLEETQCDDISDDDFMPSVHSDADMSDTVDGTLRNVEAMKETTIERCEQPEGQVLLERKASSQPRKQIQEKMDLTQTEVHEGIEESLSAGVALKDGCQLSTVLKSDELDKKCDVMKQGVNGAIRLNARRVASSSSLIRQILKYALPLPLLLVLLFGTLYLLCDDWFSELDRFGLLINPTMQHVKGAPPI